MPNVPKIRIHDVNPFMQTIRNFLLGRKHTLALRFQDALASRSPPPPVLPDGPAHKLNSNYYYSRDARREVSPPEVIAPNPKQIESGEKGETVKRITPGPIYRWD
ncbi:NADH dehydrogenase [ubiquinone] 1 alpha subcomplex subunit 7-like [Diabrotica virgifera virgifera]|uniref:NADH dehydrogenase [ubiquinone] 1 alpha subcomplex subunit 7 n=1 Tax=Diabrotica virgifera virgifera TaxID=50390 RepID=A0A6P7GDE6_DIAVI|nr:NADH dehydrogenase [ubiquinone] 1 alpha subcomplex subunit 7-like [Diabrotica virgifera virgifera]